MKTIRTALGRYNLQRRMSLSWVMAITVAMIGVTLIFIDLYSIKRSSQIERLRSQAEVAYRLIERAVLSQEAREQLTEDLALLDAAIVLHTGQLIDKPAVKWGTEARRMIAADRRTVDRSDNGIGAMLISQAANEEMGYRRLLNADGWDAIARSIPFPLIDGTTGTLVVATPSTDWVSLLRSQTVQQHLSLTGLMLALLIVGGFAAVDSLKRHVRDLTREVNSDFDPFGGHTGSAATGESDELSYLAAGLNRLKRELQVKESQIHELAFNDALTTLPNRQHFVNQLEVMFESLNAGRPDKAIVVVILNLNHFRWVNDTMGHEVGDAVLRIVALRLKSLHMHATDVPARVDGNEFASAFITDASTAVDAAGRLTTAISACLEAPIHLNGTDIDMRVTAGIAISGLHGDDSDTLMRRAYISLASAKDALQAQAVYEPTMDTARPQDLSLLSQLETAIRKNELVLHYQPKVDLLTRRVTGAEALARWAHPSRGLLGPAHFIDFAEKHGFIPKITRWTINQAMADYAELAQDRPDFCLSINVSAHDIMDSNLLTYLKAMCARHHVAPGAIMLEVTETAMMRSIDESRAALLRIREMGMRLSIDDFGIGHSSLAYLNQLPANEIKIDRSFVSRIGASDRTPVLHATINMGKSLDMSVVGEGIETEEAAAALLRWGCNTGQGYLFSKPLPRAEFKAWCALQPCTKDATAPEPQAA